MSLLGKLIGRRSAEDERRRGDDLRARGEYGLAKLAYERALELVSDRPQEQRAELERCVDECCDALARARLLEGEKLLRAGARDLAIAELQSAAETAASAELVAEAERLIDAAERRDARDKAAEVELGDDERYELIAGGFEEEQYEEYEQHGPELRSALLALYDGRAAEALPMLERAASAASTPRYLLFELGRARLLEGDVAGGREALQRFTALLGEGEGGDARLVAHMELAALHDESGDFDAAVDEYEAAVEAMPHDPRPYLAMAMFFRRSKLPAEAIEVLSGALAALDEQHRQWRFTLELGLAHADLAQDERAIELLEDVVTQLTARQHLDLPPECAVRLAALHEKHGNKPRALDLYHLLAAGSDVKSHYTYHREAARLMLETGHRADARRMLARAAELAPDDPAIRGELDRLLAELK